MAVSAAVVLLAGGQSRRMGGGDKNLMMFGGSPLMARVIKRIDLALMPAMINANGDPARYADFGLPIRPDVLAGYAGPLAGILTGFDWVRQAHPECSHMVSLATDAPFLPYDLIPRLIDGLADDADVAQAMSCGRRHPVFAVWSMALADDLYRAVMDDGVRKIDDFTARHRCVTVEFSGTPDPFMNLNRPDDVAAAQAFLSAE